MIKDFRNKKHQPITAQQVRDDLAEAERKRLEDEQRPIREAEAQLHANHVKLFEFGRTEVLAGRPDPFFELPESAVGLSMPHAEVADFVAKEAARFVAENIDFFPCRENHAAIMKFIMDQKKDILIPNADVFKAVFERLSRLDLLVHKPEPKPEPAPAPVEPVQGEQEAPPSEEMTPGWDPVTGEPKEFSARDIHHMDSETYRKAFRMWVTRDGDRRPLIRKSMFQ